MDDFLASSKTVEEASQIIRDVNVINSHANFNMHSWACNEVSALAGVINTTHPISKEPKHLCDQSKERVLGLT